jgi:hypothetical protein
MEYLIAAIVFFLLALFLLIPDFRKPDRAEKGRNGKGIDPNRPSPDYNPTPAAASWRKQKGIGEKRALSATDVPAGELWAGVNCNVPPVDVRFVPKDCPPEWRNAYTKWGDEREL